ncbi:FAD/NAD(P)-binding domain-containing protein [Aspergillus homomorphus CBS 101889]|uniref:FAD/NAD(P)-binding domain-containing protein n=1 Tax=Aspergillus homomorphus (strain CBS 101889) TaxID=1450537 RepID=A0A395HI18_ASPHC|nr:FAD/NAD(P)-binding domain-containing protein [Aspergillus homomorphus CBS 101889]RAL06628.1 FAD/NAD(P)-binding domain-containing protein [Aspergillus homomorphus CBS 101889]
MSHSNQNEVLDVAIVGGGIVGAALAIGLLARDINVTIYERSNCFSEVGAGIGFTPNAESAMKVLDPAIHAAFKKVAVQNTTDWFTWSNSGNREEGDLDEPIYKMYVGERGFEGCHRAEFLNEMLNLIPANKVKFRKSLVAVEDRGDDKKLLMRFQDGTTAQTDLVIGCDGIHSKVRRIVLGDDHPAAYAGYTHKYAFRGLVPMEKALPLLGHERAYNRHMYMGPGAHMLTFPVASGLLLNVVAFVHDEEEWTGEKLTAMATKQEAVKAFEHFTPFTRGIIDLLPETLHRWAIFDMAANPAPTYVNGRVCLAGDAAHASAPHHGAGAGMGMEDAAALVELLQAVHSQASRASSPHSLSGLLSAALATYDHIRLDRTQWLMQTSRFVGEMYEWQHSRDPAQICHEIDSRSSKIWSYNIDEMIRQTRQDFTRRLWALHAPVADSSPIKFQTGFLQQTPVVDRMLCTSLTV